MNFTCYYFPDNASFQYTVDMNMLTNGMNKKEVHNHLQNLTVTTVEKKNKRDELS